MTWLVSVQIVEQLDHLRRDMLKRCITEHRLGLSPLRSMNFLLAKGDKARTRPLIPFSKVLTQTAFGPPELMEMRMVPLFTGGHWKVEVGKKAVLPVSTTC